MYDVDKDLSYKLQVCGKSLEVQDQSSPARPIGSPARVHSSSLEQHAQQQLNRLKSLNRLEQQAHVTQQAEDTVVWNILNISFAKSNHCC